MKKKVLIVFGGESVEHDISIITALQTMMFLPKDYDFLPVYIDRDGAWWMAQNLNEKKTFVCFEKNAKNKKRVTLVCGKNILFQVKGKRLKTVCEVLCVLNCCHGRFGEDGALQGVLKGSNIPHTSCDVTSSALCMDKAFLKDVMERNNIPTPEYVCISDDGISEEVLHKTLSKLKPPVVVKPANLGSSIGVSVCKNEGELSDAIDFAFSFDKKVVVEKFVNNLREFNCACFGFKENLFCSDVNEVVQKGEVYSFEDKYLQNQSKTKKVETSIKRKVQMLTQKAYKIAGCSGVVRVDFLYDEKQRKLFLNEINTIPGSLAFYLFKGIKFQELIGCLIEDSLFREKKQTKLVKTYKSDALEVFEKTEIRGKK